MDKARSKNDALLSVASALLVLGTFYLFKNTVVSLIGFCCLVAAMIALFVYFIKSNRQVDKPLLILVLGILIWNSCSLLRDSSGTALRTFAVQTISYLFLIAAFGIGCNERMMHSYKYCLLALLAAEAPFLIMIIASGGGDFNVRMFDNTFSFVAYKSLLAVYCSLFLFERKVGPAITVSFVALFLLIGDRASSLCCIAFYLAYHLHPLLSRNRGVCWLAFILFVFLAISIPHWYVTLYGTNTGFEINRLSREYFGANFYSGRQIIWERAFESINNHILAGNGLAARVVEEGSDLSLHNTYLTILFQGGLIGLALFVGVLARLWRFVAVGSGDNIKRVAFGAFVVILLLGCFEVTMVQNTVNVSILLWFIVALGHESARCDVSLRGGASAS